MRHGMGRLRVRLNKILTETVPANGHGDGHGELEADGHAEPGEHAAISAGTHTTGDHDDDGSGS
jgi:hypothetical protein